MEHITVAAQGVLTGESVLPLDGRIGQSILLEIVVEQLHPSPDQVPLPAAAPQVEPCHILTAVLFLVLGKITRGDEERIQGVSVVIDLL